MITTKEMRVRFYKPTQTGFVSSSEYEAQLISDDRVASRLNRQGMGVSIGYRGDGETEINVTSDAEGKKVEEILKSLGLKRD